AHFVFGAAGVILRYQIVSGITRAEGAGHGGHHNAIAQVQRAQGNGFKQSADSAVDIAHNRLFSQVYRMALSILGPLAYQEGQKCHFRPAAGAPVQQTDAELMQRRLWNCKTSTKPASKNT